MKYTSQNKNRQLTLDMFRSSFEDLDKHNRWVVLGDTLPWAALEKIYNSKLHNDERGGRQQAGTHGYRRNDHQAQA